MDSNSNNLDAIGKAMQAAWRQVKTNQAKLWGQWMVIGEGLLEGRRWAMHVAGVNQPEGKGYVTAYSEWLRKYRVDDMDQSDRAKLLQLMEERGAVEEWRQTLTDPQRRNLNNPTLVWRKWQAATKVKPPKHRLAGMSAEETWSRAKLVIDEKAERIAELEQELAAVKEKPDKGSPLAEADLLLDYLQGRGLTEPEACAVMEIALQALIKVTEEK